MKQIDVADQPWLGLGRTIQITVDGIRYRLFRASVTVAVIAVAVAFLMNILSESLIKKSVASSTRDKIVKMRLVYTWSARLTSPGSIESVLSELAQAGPEAPIYREAAQMTGLNPADMEALRADAERGFTYLEFFRGLDYAKRRSLIHTASGIGIFARLQTEKGMEQFQESLSHIKSISFPATAEELDEFLAKWDTLKTRLGVVITARKAAIAKIRKSLGETPILEALAEAEGDFAKTIRDAGFVFDAEKVAPIVSDQAKRLLDVLRMEKTMDSLACRQLIAQRANVMPADVNVMMMWGYLDNFKFSTEYLARMNAENEKALKTAASEDGDIKESDKGTRLDVEGLTADRLVDLAEARAERAALLRAERLTVGAGGGFMGLGERLGWLLFVSLLVCGIGISNAMLMTVTERFTEIATLKCLGALDGFIMIMFVLESSFLGIVGGIFGAILGALIGLSRMLAAFGFRFAGAIPASDIIIAIFVSVLMGMFLAAIAAVLPSFKAARLAPMEAMRIE